MDFEKYRKLAQTKPAIGKQEFLQVLTSLEIEYKSVMTSEGRIVNIGKVYRPNELARYDIITSVVCGQPHPCMIYKVDNDYIYGVCFSSTEAPHNLYTFEKSRIFGGKFMTNTLVREAKDVALNRFVGIFDNKAEADIAFARLKSFYKDLFKL